MYIRHNLTINELESAARDLIMAYPNNRIFAFYGKMGAGKTTFIQAICRALHSTDTITSPSFAIVNEYSSSESGSIFHFDFYRIKNIEEAFDLGYEDYFYSGNYCLIEWPEKINALLPQEYVEVTIDVDENLKRSITARNFG